MNTKKTKSGETVHDFRNHKLRWGWNGMSWNVAEDGKSAKMMGVGTGLKVGHFIAVNNGEEVTAHKITEIEYDTNPKDMFTCTVSGSYSIENGTLDD